MAFENMMNLVTKSGEKHGLINRVANSVPDTGFKNFPEKDRVSMEKARKEDNKAVKARYINHKDKSRKLTLPYCKYAGDTVDTWSFIHNQEYDLPMGLVKQVNDRTWAPKKRSGLINPNTSEMLESDQPEDQEHEFVPVGF